MERIGLPIDWEYLARLLEVWPEIRMHYIRRDDVFDLYDEEGSFVEQRLWDLIEMMGWDWPRTPTGRYELKMKTLGKQARRYPELMPLVLLRDCVAELRIGKLANTNVSDGHSRPVTAVLDEDRALSAFAKDKIFCRPCPRGCTGSSSHRPAWHWSNSTSGLRRSALWRRPRTTPR
jgi:hypothetical protein